MRAHLSLDPSPTRGGKAAFPPSRAGKGARGVGPAVLVYTAVALCAVAVCTCVAGAISHTATPRFFFAGDGHLALQHGHFATTLDVRYRRADGTYDPEALAQINHFFRSRVDGREARIPLRLVELLAYVQNRYHPRQMILLSGFRSLEFNSELRDAGQVVALASLHTQAMAADVTFTGIDMQRLWRQLRELHAGGVGYYRKSKFLHIDTGPPRFWEETTSRVSENLSAGNARVFVRTDFDRYDSIEGAVCSLHSVTAFPLLVSPHATLARPSGTTAITLQPVSDGIAQREGCFAIAAPAQAYEFRVVTAAPVAGSETARARILLATCEPRVGKTPAEIESNLIEVRD